MAASETATPQRVRPVSVPTRYLGYTLVVSDTGVRIVKNGRTLSEVLSVPTARRLVRSHRRTERQEARK